MKDRLEYIFFISFSFLFRITGLKIARRFAVFLAFIFFYLIPIRKKTVFENLNIAFPDLSSKEKNKIAFGSYLSFAISLVEILYLPWMKESEMKSAVEIENLDLITEKNKLGNGVILLSAHFGNWEYIAASASLQLNKKFHIIVKNQRNRLVNEWMNSMRTRWLNDVVTLGVSVRNIYAVLKNNGIAAMVADQRGPEEGLKLEFFGKKTSVYTGPAVLSLKTGAPIIFGIPIRQKDFSYKATLIELDQTNLPDDFDEKVKIITERMIRYLEKIISQNPEQWLWMHRRWKH
ncbi:Lipid A biosynthesis lauroyl acyltransferase [Ignavibacterium album JCM 16511]|uniref:Lipid A biosynthesis lauroyl acyltransferase n=1 Tax=Ignavibacterium album (strain DSM 19864 / JCM 16511 / NBRC 101810 / Mat9-16) TaxID=945713 RepID=I0AHL6_IGNAJ|nr:lysophospholipid acyltransferase family protein [Ignavibacterium album]AFH48473.1 Lipid A biosynthesis lauroyl acyltransferase [Ignavibacterium album JCM 16511]